MLGISQKHSTEHVHIERIPKQTETERNYKWEDSSECVKETANISKKVKKGVNWPGMIDDIFMKL